MPQARTGGSTPPPVDKEAPVEGARIVLNRGDRPTANLVVSVRLPNDCHKIYQYEFLSSNPTLYPWPTARIRYSPKGGGGECSEGHVIVEASKALEGKGHLYEPCKTYQVEVNGKRFPALATDGAVDCPPASTQPASGDVLALADVRDIRLNHPTTEPAPLLIAGYLLTRSCIRPGKHQVERDGDRLKVYVVVTDIDAVAPPYPQDQCRPIQQKYDILQQEYSIPLEGVTPGQVLTVWVNGIDRTLRVPEPGQVTEPKVIEIPPQEGRAVALPPPPPFEVNCVVTKKGPLPIVAVIGEDRIPTGFDANNTGSCKFSEPVTAVRLRLWYGISDRSDHQMAQIEFDEPLLQLSFPFPEHVPVPTIDADLTRGPYLLEVWAIGPGGELVEIRGFKNVDLVSVPTPVGDRPVPVQKPTAGPLPTATPEPAHDWDVESYAQPADHHDRSQWTTTYPGELARQLANRGLEEIQRGVGGASSGWSVDRVYKLKLELTPSNFRVLSNGNLVIDAPTSRDYTSGHLAYYTFSQANISFWEATGTRQ